MEEYLKPFYCLSWMTGMTCLLYLLYVFIRKYSYVSVNCWFCNKNTDVLYDLKNDWFCKNCDQYNGFTDNGDYRRPIPEQHDEKLNKANHGLCTGELRSFTSTNGLCRLCNANQELKIRQLAMYIPMHEKNYDSEINEFSRKLEESYRLCAPCEKIVKMTLKMKTYTRSPSAGSENIDSELSTSSPKTSTKTQIVKYLFLVLIISLSWYLWKYDGKNIFIYARSVYGWLQQKFSNSPIRYLSPYRLLLLNTNLIITAILYVREFSRWRCNRLIWIALTFSFLISNYASVYSKSIGIILLFMYLVVKCSTKIGQIIRKDNASMLSAPFLHKLVDENPSTSSSAVTESNSPLCNRFSSMQLTSATWQCHNRENNSYLFKRINPLIKPAVLKLNDDGCITPCKTSPTNSSGFESNYSGSKESCSDFDLDSISQVGQNKESWSNLQHSMMIARRSIDNRFYGARPCTTSQDNSVPKPFIISSFPFIVCSVTFFVLGYYCR